MSAPPYDKRSVAAALGVWGIVAVLVAGILGLVVIPVHGNVPTYAMESRLIFRLERSLAIAAALILPTLIFGPLLSGALPRRLSSSGIDWDDDRDNVVTALDALNGRLAELDRALNEIADLNDG